MVKPALAYLDVIAAARADHRPPGRRLPRVRRVLDDQGGRRARLDRRRRRRPRAPHRHQAGGRRRDPHLPRPRSGRGLCCRDASDGAPAEERPRRPPWPGTTSSVRRASGDPRRGQQPGARVQERRRHALLRRPRRGRRTCGTSRAVATSTSSSRTAPSSPATPTRRSSRPCSARRPTARPTARPPSARCELAEAIAARVPVGGARAPGVVRHRGDHVGRSGWPAATPAGRKVVKFAGNYHGHGDLLLAEAGSGLAALGLPGLGGRHRRGGVRHGRRALQPGARARRRHRVRHRRADRRQHGPGPARRRVPQGAARRVRPRRRPARVRRGDHRVPRGLRRRPGDMRHHARPLHLRQGDRRRPQHRRLRRAPRRHAAGRAARARVPGRHAVREPARHRRRAGRPRPARHGGLRHAHRHRRAAGRRAARRASTRPASTAVVPQVDSLVGLFFCADGAGRLRRAPSAPTPRATPRSSTPCSTAASPSPPAPTR